MKGKRAGLKRKNLRKSLEKEMNDPKTKDRVVHYHGDLHNHSDFWSNEDLARALQMVLDEVPEKRIVDEIGRGREFIRKIRDIIQRMDHSARVFLGASRDDKPWTARDYWAMGLAFKERGRRNGAWQPLVLSGVLGRSPDEIEKRYEEMAKLHTTLTETESKDVKVMRMLDNCRTIDDYRRLRDAVESRIQD